MRIKLTTLWFLVRMLYTVSCWRLQGEQGRNLMIITLVILVTKCCCDKKRDKDQFSQKIQLSVISRSYGKFKQHTCCRNKGELRNNALWRLLGAVGQAGVAPCEVNRISLGFWIPSCGFRISLSVGHGFWIPIFSQDSGFLELNSEIQSPGWRIPQGKISRIS